MRVNAITVICRVVQQHMLNNIFNRLMKNHLTSYSYTTCSLS